MPFLNKAILVELLKTYPESAQIESNYKSLTKNYKVDPLSFLQMVRDGSIKFRNTSFGFLGFNTNDKSGACYLEIRALIDDATRYNKVDTWAEIICAAGESGYHTFTKSIKDSRLCRASFALLMYIRNQIDNRIKSIDNKIKIAAEKIKPFDPTKPFEDRLKLVRDKIFLDEDDELALKIHASIIQRISECKKFIQEALGNIQRMNDLKLCIVYANTLEVNAKIGQDFKAVSEEVIKVTQRHLYYLGDDSSYLKPARELFPAFPFTIDKLCKDYNLTETQAKGLNVNLPVFLQRIYTALYIKDHRPDLKHITDECKVIESFEQLERIKTRIPAVKSDTVIEDKIEKVEKGVDPVEAFPILEIDTLSSPHAPGDEIIFNPDLTDQPAMISPQFHDEPESKSEVLRMSLFKTEPTKEIKQSPISSSPAP